MEEPRCPGQDQRQWKFEDICYVPCSSCGAEIEIWKDEPFRLCPTCGTETPNPRLKGDCATWCKHADKCLAARHIKKS